MKKWTACLLVLAMAIPLFGITGSAEDVNFLPDESATFESGSVGGWKVLTNGTLTVEDNPDGDGKVLAYTVDEDDPKSWASPVLNIFPYVKENLTEETELTVAFDIYYPDDDIKSIVRIRTSNPEDYSKCDEDGKNYCTLGSVSGSAGEWNHVTVIMPITEDDLAKKNVAWNLCFDNISGFCDSTVYFDNFYVGLEPETEHEPIPEKTTVEPGEKLGVGTIRWDAFEESAPDGDDPCSQVARVLSPAKYHAQAPFFADINDDGTVSFPKYTVETWEAEAAYAVQNGLDYFAYLWYDTTSAMSQPRKLHLQSAKKDTIKMTAIFEGIRDDKSMGEFYTALKDSCWLRVSGRPVVFVYGLYTHTEEELTKMVFKLRQGAADAGVKEALYIIGMGPTKDAKAVSSYKKADFDALSWYSFSAAVKDMPYVSLAANAEKTVSEVLNLCRALKLDLVPVFTAGRDSRARIQTGVTWVDGDPNAAEDKDKPYGNKYALPPTMEELQTHIENILKLTQENKDVCVTQLVCSYGWNEHEEGGWLCPTLAVDENGNQLYNEDGSKKINTERLNALRLALGLPEATAEPTAAPQNTAGPTEEPTAAPVPEDTGISPWAIVLPIVGVLIIAGVVVIILKKKKNGEKA